MTRTDAHSPKNLVTEDYEFAYAYDAHPTEGYRPIGVLNALIAEGWHFGQVHGGDTCDHCGTGLRYVAVLQHLPSHTLIKVGETCLDNRFSRASSEFHALRAQARLNREEATRQERIAAAVEANPVLVWLTYPEALHGGRTEAKVCEGDSCFYTWKACEGHTDFADFNSFLDDIAAKFRRYIDLSDKQIAAVERAVLRDTERRDRAAARRAEEQAAKEAGEIEAVPADAGRIVITGEVVSLKTVESDFGLQFKMLVRDDRGFKVYGTEPSSINPAKGDRVTFTARVERSRDDEFFGFYSRPTKAAVIAEATAA